MKLFLDEAVEIKTDEVLNEETGEKSLYIEGIFLQSGIKNRNGRIYPNHIMEAEVNRYIKDTINTNRAYGELGHPNGPSINLDKVSHMIKELRKDGNNYIGKAKIMDTPMGNIARNLIKEGAGLGVSSRGMGTLKPTGGIMEVQGDFRLATAADIVADPSAPDAFVQGIMEGVEWIWDNGILKAQALENAVEVVESAVRSRTLDVNRKLEIMNAVLANRLIR